MSRLTSSLFTAAALIAASGLALSAAPVLAQEEGPEPSGSPFPSPSPSPGGGAADSDGDGLDDDNDPYPCDANAGAVVYVPSEGENATIFFEDQWPALGDLDFNDVVISFNYAFHLTSDGRVSAIRATFNTAALGGHFSNGLGLRLPVWSGAAATVTRRVGGGDPTPATLYPSDGEGELIVQVSPNLREVFGGVAEQINSLPTLPRLSGQTIEITIDFAEPQDIYAGGAPYDLFIFRAEDPSHEIHLPNYGGTPQMNYALFGTQDDDSNLEGTWFVDRRGMPFAMIVPVNAQYPLEGVCISSLYPDIVEFATSQGEYGNNFYESNLVAEYAYRDVNGEGPLVPALLPPPSSDRCCIVEGAEYEFDTPEGFAYDDLSEGTSISLGDDAVSSALPIGFNFTFDGQSFSSVFVASNGFMSFLPNQGDGCCNGLEPGPNGPNGVVAGFWEDLNPSAGGTIRYQTFGESPNRRFVVEFADVPHFGSAENPDGGEGGEPIATVVANGVNTVSFQLVLFEDGEIEIRLLDAATDGGVHFVGVEGVNGDAGATIAFGRNFAFYNQAFRIYPFSNSNSLTGGPYSVDEYGEITLFAGCTGDRVITWDFDGDGDYDDGEGPTPLFSAVGYDGPASHPVVMRSCTMGGSCETYPSVVEVNNVDPTITTQPSREANGGDAYAYQPQATDPAGEADPITWSLVEGPAGMNVDASTGLVSWTVSPALANSTVTIRADDGDGGFSMQSWAIDITSHGPDAFGYSWGATNYAYEDISGFGTNVYLSDDQVSGAVPVGFGFGYYGQTYTQAYISSNGFITFLPNQSNGCCSGFRAGNSGNPDGFIAGYWEDLYPPAGGTITYATLGTAGNRRFIVQFTNIQHFGLGNPVNFQLVMFEADGSFEIRHQSSRTDGGQHSVGFQGPGQSGGLSIRYGTFTLTDTAFRVTRAAN